MKILSAAGCLNKTTFIRIIKNESAYYVGKNHHWNTKQLLMLTLINASQGVTIYILIYQ